MLFSSIFALNALCLTTVCTLILNVGQLSRQIGKMKRWYHVVLIILFHIRI